MKRFENARNFKRVLNDERALVFFVPTKVLFHPLLDGMLTVKYQEEKIDLLV